MTTPLDLHDRHIIPRWRDSKTTVSRGEAALNNDSQRRAETQHFDLPLELQKRRAEWERERSLGYATDLISAAFVLDHFDVAAEAARYLLQIDTGASPLAQSLAKRVLGINDVGTLDLPFPLEDELLTREIALLKVRLRRYPRNAFAWLDIARLYTVLGQGGPASRAIDIAIGQARDNRQILRSTNRFFLHSGDPERAAFELRQSVLVAADPWLLAPEIATGSILGRSSQLIKRGRKVLEDDRFTHEARSELACALAREEIRSGNAKGARKLIRAALRVPTENAVAQVEVMSRMLGIAPPDLGLIETVAIFEARATEAYFSNNFALSLDEAERWWRDEPFSERPAVHGSFVAGALVGEFARGVEIAKRGLRSNPHSVSLLNNLSYNLAKLWRIDEAREVIASVPHLVQDPGCRIAVTATKGLIEYRAGNPNRGRALYQEAIDAARDRGDKFGLALAILNLAKEECVASGMAMNPYVSEALEASGDVKGPGGEVVRSAAALLLGPGRIEVPPTSGDPPSTSIQQ